MILPSKCPVNVARCALDVKNKAHFKDKTRQERFHLLISQKPSHNEIWNDQHVHKSKIMHHNLDHHVAIQLSRCKALCSAGWPALYRPLAAKIRSFLIWFSSFLAVHFEKNPLNIYTSRQKSHLSNFPPMNHFCIKLHVLNPNFV